MENILPDAPSKNHESPNHDDDADPPRINPRSDGAATIFAHIFGKFGPLLCFDGAAGPKVGIKAFQPMRFFQSYGMKVASGDSLAKDSSGKFVIPSGLESLKVTHGYLCDLADGLQRNLSAFALPS